MATDWRGTAAAYDASFGRLCAGALPFILAWTECLPDDAVALDVGTGTGSVAAALAERFRTSGIDADADMIDYAGRVHPEIPFSVGALPSLPFESGHANLTTANFVVNHVAKPRASLRELARVTKPGGVLIVTIWPSTPVSAVNRLWNRVIATAGATPPPGQRLPPEDDFDRSINGLADVLTECGLEDTHSNEIHWDFRIDRDRLWLAAEAGIATIGATYRQQPDAIRHAMRTAFDELTPERDLVLPATAVIATARVT